MVALYFFDINEEDISKEEIIEFPNFRNKYFGISETTLMILKNRKKFPCILAENNKVFKDYTEEVLFIDFQDLFNFIKEEKRKNKLE